MKHKLRSYNSNFEIVSSDDTSLFMVRNNGSVEVNGDIVYTGDPVDIGSLLSLTRVETEDDIYYTTPYSAEYVEQLLRRHDNNGFYWDYFEGAKGHITYIRKWGSGGFSAKILYMDYSFSALEPNTGFQINLDYDTSYGWEIRVSDY